MFNVTTDVFRFKSPILLCAFLHLTCLKFLFLPPFSFLLDRVLKFISLFYQLENYTLLLSLGYLRDCNMPFDYHSPQLIGIFEIFLKKPKILGISKFLYPLLTSVMVVAYFNIYILCSIRHIFIGLYSQYHTYIFCFLFSSFFPAAISFHMR